jgi:hypothetical protein
MSAQVVTEDPAVAAKSFDHLVPNAKIRCGAIAERDYGCIGRPFNQVPNTDAVCSNNLSGHPRAPFPHQAIIAAFRRAALQSLFNFSLSRRYCQQSS